MTTSGETLQTIAEVLSAFASGDYQTTKINSFVPTSDVEVQIFEALSKIQRRNLQIEEVLQQSVIGNYSVTIAAPEAGDTVSCQINQVLTTLRDVVAQAKVISLGDYSAEISPQSEKDELGIALFTMTKTLREIAEVSSNIAAGDFSKLVEVKGDRDYLAKAINMMICSLREMTRQAKAIAEGDYSLEIGLRSEHDELARSIDTMMRVIRSQLVALQQSNKGLLEFAHVASHDLNAPLCKIQYSCDLIKEACQGKLQGNLFQLFDVILRSCDQMTNLINDLLAHARVGGAETIYTKIDLNLLLADIISNFSHQFENVGAQIQVAQLPVVWGDRTSLIQLFQNLVGNALNYRGRSPLLVEITSCSDEKSWTIAVKDNGIGIAATNHLRIFDPFVRLHSTSDVSGTGIGLATCNKIAKQLGGKIWVESEMGSGSTFFVNFPKRVFQSESKSLNESRRKRILVVDDDKDQLVILATILEKGDFEVETADSSLAGLASFQSNHFDLVISDVQMPMMSGAQFLTELRSQSNIPVLMLTSSGTEREQELLELGATDFCTKKDAYARLMSKVVTLLNGS